MFSKNELDLIIENGIKEDIGRGDITSAAVIDSGAEVSFSIVAKEKMIICGVDVVKRVFKKVDKSVVCTSKFNDGKEANAGDIILEGHGNSISILAAERLSLNLISFMSSIATTTYKYVQETKGTNTKILDTRKTFPNLRILQKYAVSIGGGYNHRFGLYDSIMIKDNHISICGGIKAVLAKIKSISHLNKIEIECDNLEQVKYILEVGGVDIIMLDNMSVKEIKEAIDYIDKRVLVEVSGNVTFEKIKDISILGADFISLGCLTNSIKNVDIGLDIY